MDPLLLRSAFRIAFLIFVLALVILPFENPASPEFVATVLALLIGLIFGALVTLLARTTLPPRRSTAPNSVDKATVKDYKRPDSRTGGDR